MATLDTLALRQVDIPKQDGEDLVYKMRSVALSAGVDNTFTMTFNDRNADPLDLADLGFTADTSETADARLVGKIREAVLLSSSTEKALTVTTTDPANGELKITVDKTAIKNPGVYRIAIGLQRTTNDEVVSDNELLVFAEPSMWSDTMTGAAFPKLDQIRLSLRDSDPKENELLESVDFSLTDICQAAISTCQMWNSVPPPLPPIPSTQLSDLDTWITGIHTFLFEMAVEHYRRNRLPYSSGGVQLDDKAKAPDYFAAWQLKYQILRDKIQTKKIIKNRMKVYGVVSHRGIRGSF